MSQPSHSLWNRTSCPYCYYVLSCGSFCAYTGNGTARGASISIDESKEVNHPEFSPKASMKLEGLRSANPSLCFTCRPIRAIFLPSLNLLRTLSLGRIKRGS